ncbi:TMEM175 family protein [Herbiconiux sp. P15]|uniref:TMEM175 family protein n=1 Tax=Herbiconiux liukaitaii TaxID=3342799 RepID=UPI0035BA4437
MSRAPANRAALKRTERGFDRLVNFSDAVVAIAITLLILPLVDVAGELGDATLGELLDKEWPSLMVFAISFAVIGRFWLAHHRAFEQYADYNTALMWTNLFWLLTIVFLPFPTELMAQGGNTSQATVLLYIGTMVLTSAAASLSHWIVIRHPELQAPDVRGTLSMWPSLTALGMLVVALVLSQIVPGLGLFSLFALLLLGPIQAVQKRRAPRRPAAESPPPPA